MGSTWSKLAEHPAPGWQKFAFINSAAQILGYWFPNLLLYIIWKKGWFARYKIQKGRMPPQALINKELVENVLGTIAAPFLAALMYKIMTNTWQNGWKQAIETATSPLTTDDKKHIQDDQSNEECKTQDTTSTNDDSSNDTRLGWSKFRWTGKAPSWLKTLSMIMIGYLGYDFMFYWFHRLLHIKSLYKRIHSTHHKFFATIGIASNYAHPIETLFQALAYYLPMAATGWLFGDLHSSTWFWYSMLRWTETVDAHSGYSFPWSPYTFIPLFGGASMHDFHHSRVIGNFGATVIWDSICGTNAVYLKMQAMETAKKAAEKAAQAMIQS